MSAATPPRRRSLRARLLLALLRARRLSPAGMARYARRHTRHYADTLRDWDGVTFADVPLLTKEQARTASPYDFLSRPLRKKVRLYAETTGSVGSPTPSFLTAREFRAAALLARISPYGPALRAILRGNRTCVNGLAMGFTIAGLSFGDLLGSLGGLVANAGSRSTLATPERIARSIARLRPSIIAATPGDFLAWMRIVREDHPGDYDAVVGNLRALLSTAELCAASRVERIGDEFGILHVDVYACVEGFFSLPCPCGEKHVLPAWDVEVLDEELRPIGARGTGRFAFTGLVKRSTPMVRYLLDDWVTIFDSECPWGFRTSITPHGRHELTLDTSNGRIGARNVEEALFRHGLLGDYRVEIDDRSCRAALESYGAEFDRDGATAALEALLGLPVRTELVPYGTLTPFREVRPAKPILRLRDDRSGSGQSIPQHL